MAAVMEQDEPTPAPADPGAETPEAKKARHAEIIADAQRYLEFCIAADGQNHANGLDDLQFLAGDQWAPEARRQRELDGRPCLTINKLPTFLHQITNDQRQNVCSIHVAPVDSGADIDTAEVEQGMIRHIEYSSNADIAYDTAVNSAAAIGFGYFRLVTEYESPDSFDQVIRFKRVRNAFTVYFDPASEEPDGSDARRAMITGKMPHDLFKVENPGAEATEAFFTTGIGDKGNLNWLGADFVRVAEFYRIEQTAAVLIKLSNDEIGYEEDLLELPKGVTIVQRRASYKQRVMWYKLTAAEVLEETEIKCDWIPVFPVYGDEIDLDGRVVRSGLIRAAKDPARMYNYWSTAATEEVALRTKTPFIGAEGQFEGYEDDWNQANVRSLPYLEYKPVTVDGVLAPAPQRQPMTDVPQGHTRMLLQANDDIKATTGLFDSSIGNKGNATSGVQERAQQRQGDLANFHYTDNRNRSVRQAGRCLLSMIPHYYNTQRVVRIMGEDGKIDFAEINKPIPLEEQKPDEKTGAIRKVLNDMTVGEYDVTVSAGPSYNTLRQEASESMIEMGGKWPKLMEVAGDKVIRAMDWPGAQEIADRVAKTIPPELRDEEDGEQEPMVQTPKGPIPLDQAGAMLVEMDQQITLMGQELTEAKSGVEKERIASAARIEVAEINAVSKQDVEELKGFIQLTLQQMQPPPGLEAEVAADAAKDDAKAPEAVPDPRIDQIMQMLTQQQQAAQAAPPPKPRTRRARIRAPSGAEYTVDMDDTETLQ